MQKVIYGAVFVFAFALVTGALIYLSSSYRNIFKFDFAPAGTPYENVAVKNSNKKSDVTKDLTIKEKSENKSDTTTIAGQIPASGNTKDSLYKALLNDLDKLQKENDELKKLKDQLAQKDIKIKEIEKISEIKADSSYTKWKKEMVKLYEKMDSKAAAKLIQTLNENQAKDILNIMKKKKAAEIISQLHPEVASRLVRFE